MENTQEPVLSGVTCLSKQDWLTLSFIKGVGPARLDRLFTYLISFEQEISRLSHNYSAKRLVSYELLIQLKWPSETANKAITYLAHGWLDDETKTQLNLTLDWLDQSPLHHLVFRGEDAYPSSLNEIPVAPLFLYIKGDLTALALPRLAIVGARKATAYGLDTAFNLAQTLAEQRVSIVSGGAIGIDTSAHQGALSIQGSSIAVMGAGLLNLYPKHNTSLFHSIIDHQGCLLSEYPLKTNVQARLFPARNRIISGLSLGVIVVEASFKSGSLISANYALEHDREVFAVPGRIIDPASAACLDLIKQGAKLITCTEDVLTEFPILKREPQLLVQKQNDLNFKQDKNVYPRQKESMKPHVSRETRIEKQVIPSSVCVKSLPEKAQLLLSEIDDCLVQKGLKNEFELDQLVSLSGFTIDEVMQVCMELELAEILDPLITGYARRLESSR